MGTYWDFRVNIARITSKAGKCPISNAARQTPPTFWIAGSFVDEISPARIWFSGGRLVFIERMSTIRLVLWASWRAAGALRGARRDGPAELRRAGDSGFYTAMSRWATGWLPPSRAGANVGPTAHSAIGVGMACPYDRTRSDNPIRVFFCFFFFWFVLFAIFFFFSSHPNWPDCR